MLCERQKNQNKGKNASSLPAREEGSCYNTLPPEVECKSCERKHDMARKSLSKLEYPEIQD